MKIELKYPVFAFQKNKNMVYVFFEEKHLKSTSTRFLSKIGFIGDTIVDSLGTLYKIKAAFKIRYRGLWGYSLLLKGRQILVDFEFEQEVETISLSEFKLDILKRIDKTKRIWQSGWNIDELKNEINKSDSFADIAFLLK